LFGKQLEDLKHRHTLALDSQKEIFQRKIVNAQQSHVLALSQEQRAAAIKIAQAQDKLEESKKLHTEEFQKIQESKVAALNALAQSQAELERLHTQVSESNKGLAEMETKCSTAQARQEECSRIIGDLEDRRDETLKSLQSKEVILNFDERTCEFAD